MKMIKRYAGILMMLTLLVGFTSCESEEETEFNLPGEWYTNEEIDFGAYTWGRGTLMTFNARNQGTIGSAGDPNYLVFEWRWIDGGYNSMELFFYGDRTYAYIWGAEATGRTFSGTWYNNWQDFRDRIDGQPFYICAYIIGMCVIENPDSPAVCDNDSARQHQSVNHQPCCQSQQSAFLHYSIRKQQQDNPGKSGEDDP